MERLDEASIIGLRSLAFSLAAAYHSGAVEAKWGGVFGMEFVNKSLGTTFVHEGIRWQAKGEPLNVAKKVMKEPEGKDSKTLPIEEKTMTDVDEPKKKREASSINGGNDSESKLSIHSV